MSRPLPGSITRSASRWLGIHFVSALVSSSGGTAVPFIDVFFIDDATPGGSFTYTSSDGIATSNEATAPVINNATNVTAPGGTGGHDTIIAKTAPRHSAAAAMTS